MAIRKTCKWCIIIVLLSIATGGGYGWWFWSHSNELLLQKVRASLAKIAPKWDIEIGSARYDWHRRIHLFGVTLRDPTGDKNLATVPEIVLTIDREKFTNDQQVVIQHVHVKNPSLRLSRDANNKWNWMALPKLPKRETPHGFPDWTIENGRVNVEFSFPDNNRQQVLALQSGKLKVVPKGRGHYSLKGEIVPEGIGVVGFEGEWNPKTGGWFIEGKIHQQTSIENIVDFTAKVSPKLRSLLDVLSPKDKSSASRNGRAERQAVGQGAQGSVNIGFRFAQWEKDTELEYHILTKIERAQMAHPALPFPLYDMKGQVIWSHRRVVLQNLTAGNGATRITLNGQIDKEGTGRIDLDLRNLIVNSKLRRHMPQSWLQPFDTIHPEGRMNIVGAFSLENNKKWVPHNFVIGVEAGSILPEKFSYPVQNLKGSVVQRGKQWDLDFWGTAASQPVSITGRLIDPGPKVDARFDVNCPSLKIDQTFLKACNPALRRALEKLSLKGSTQVRLQLHRPAGLNQPFRTVIYGSFQNASLNYRFFPYRISGLSGSVEYDSLTQRWSFLDLKGNHGRAKLFANGSLDKQNGKSSFRMTIRADDVPFDRELKFALQSDLQSLWDKLSPQATMNLVSKIRWVDGQQVAISLPSIKIRQGSFRLAAFPYDINRVTAHLAWNSPTLDIHSLEGYHRQTKLTALGFVKTDPSGEWRLNLSKLKTQNLVADQALREALPEGLRTALKTLNPRGPFTLSGGLDMKGTDRETDPVTAAWDILCEFPNNTLDVGVQLQEVRGTVTTRGKWDGTNLEMREGNHISLDRAKVWGYQLRDIQGPYRFSNQKLLVGSIVPFQPLQKKTIPDRDHLTAKAIGGVITLDSLIDFRDRVSYRGRLQMRKGNLGLYARTYYPQTKNVKGTIKAWLDFWGTGSGEEAIRGRGQVRISPAALYELPVFFQILNVMDITASPNKAAFKYAFAEFSIRNRTFDFKQIDLVGDSIYMRGRGRVDFDKNLALNFYSEMPRKPPPIPFVKEIVRGATTGWVGVEVRGKTSSPSAKIRTLPRLDDALQKFLKALPTAPFLNPALAPIGFLPGQFFPQPRPPNRRPANNVPRRNPARIRK